MYTHLGRIKGSTARRALSSAGRRGAGSEALLNAGRWLSPCRLTRY
jgi:hypothetical protein